MEYARADSYACVVALQNLERHRSAVLREVKVEADDFTPQVRSFPIAILQPDSSEVACGRKLSFQEGHNQEQQRLHQPALSPPNTQSGAPVGEDSKEKSGIPSEKEGPIQFNPITHYLTGELCYITHLGSTVKSVTSWELADFVGLHSAFSLYLSWIAASSSCLFSLFAIKVVTPQVCKNCSSVI